MKVIFFMRYTTKNVSDGHRMNLIHVSKSEKKDIAELLYIWADSKIQEIYNKTYERATITDIKYIK